ncbi:MAG: hypothetical protein EU550_03485 [Promethearchaeota archaeon]|nr:MAG: hypothetical protein EU550_03485 [Candidatus Lokiarchaeota archaeon]
MRFCPVCNNLLYTKDNKLFCRICHSEFEMDEKDKINLKLRKFIKHELNDLDPIIIRKRIKNKQISLQDRKAFEDFFKEYGYSSS